MKFDRIADDGATAYTAGVERVDPEEHPSLASAGYHSETTLYVVMAGGETYASHDRYAIARKLPGDASWVTSALRSLEREYFEVGE